MNIVGERAVAMRLMYAVVIGASGTLVLSQNHFLGEYIAVCHGNVIVW